MDFLITPRHRWIYVALFGVMGVNLFYVLISVFPVNADNVFLWLFLNLGKCSNNSAYVTAWVGEQAECSDGHVLANSVWSVLPYQGNTLEHYVTSL